MPVRLRAQVQEVLPEQGGVSVARGVISPRILTAVYRARHRAARQAHHGSRAADVPALRQRPEFVAQALVDWLKAEGVSTAHIQPGKPWQNGLNESFNGKLRDECLDMEWFPNRREAVVVIEAFRKKYNEQRPHSSLDYRTPLEFKALVSQRTANSAPQPHAVAATSTALPWRVPRRVQLPSSSEGRKRPRIGVRTSGRSDGDRQPSRVPEGTTRTTR